MDPGKIESRSARGLHRRQAALFLVCAALLTGLGCNLLAHLPQAGSTPPGLQASATGEPGRAPGSTEVPPTLTPATPEASATHLPPAPGGLRLVGYFTSWSLYARGYQAGDVPGQKLTHLNYAFVDLTAAGECQPGDPNADETNLPGLEQLRRDYPHLKMLISVGGPGTAPKFALAASTPAGRERLARSCVEFMHRHGFQGIDLDWEYPAAEDRENFPELLAELRRQLDAPGSPERPLLTIAAGASQYQIEDLIFSGEHSILPSLDWINLMTYDFHGPWSQRTNFNAPLYASPSDPAENELERSTFNVHSAVQAYLSAGVPARQLVVGVPFFARGWQGVPAENEGLYQVHSGAAPGTWGGEGGTYDYQDLAKNYLNNEDYAQSWHEQALVPWLYSPSQGLFISYDDPRSLALKAAYVRQNQLGGIMIWQLAADDAQATLLSSLFEALFQGQ